MNYPLNGHYNQYLSLQHLQNKVKKNYKSNKKLTLTFLFFHKTS